MKKNSKKIIDFLQRFFTLDDTPHRIAAGAAVGVFMGIMPVESISTSLIVTTLFRLNKVSALVGVAATNVWAMILALPFAALSGGFLFGTNPSQLADEFNRTYQGGWGYFLTKTSFFRLTLPLLVGYFVVGVIVSLICYFILYFMLKNRKHLFLK